jgi:hypothetical protein
MKKKIFFILVVIGFTLFLGSCRGLKSAPPCPAYSAVELPAKAV